MVQCMCILNGSSVPQGLIVAEFFMHASVPFAQLCLEDTIANTKGKRKNWPKRGLKCYVTPSFLGVPHAKRRE